LRQQYNSLQDEQHQKQIESDINTKDLQIALEKADAIIYSLSEIYTNFIHDFRTPLGGLLGFSELLIMCNETNEMQKEYLEILTSSSKSLLHVLNLMSDHCKLAMGQMTIESIDTDINKFITNVCSAALEKAKTKGIDFKYRNPLAFKKSIIKTDEFILSRTCYILIDYFLRSLNNGSIEFGYCVKMGTTNKVGEPVNPTVLEFFVKCKGGWQSNYDQAEIYTFFNNTNNQDKRRCYWFNELSLIKQYAEMLGGKIWVQKEKGNRISVYFTLPYMHDENLSQDACYN
jgi:signal transduction histidine kinase